MYWSLCSQKYASHCNVLNLSLNYHFMLPNMIRYINLYKQQLMLLKILLCINLHNQHTTGMHQILLPKRIHQSPLSCMRAFVYNIMLNAVIACIHHSITNICSTISFYAFIFMLNTHNCHASNHYAKENAP